MNAQNNNTNLLLAAAECGDAAEVQRLIPISNPKRDNSCALQLAAKNGHTKCVQLLIPVSRPKDDNSLALQWAARGEHAECVDLLFDVSDPSLALQHLQRQYVRSRWNHLEEKINIQQQQKKLLDEATRASGQPRSKNTRKL